MNRFTSFLIGVASGALIGSTLGILFAPDEGKETRDRISYQLSRLQARIKELTEAKEIFVNEAHDRGIAHINNTKREARKLQLEIEKLNKEIEDLSHKKQLNQKSS